MFRACNQWPKAVNIGDMTCVANVSEKKLFAFLRPECEHARCVACGHQLKSGFTF